MRRVLLLAGASLALTSAWALAQDAPESLLPPGFDEPAPRPAPAPQQPRSAPAQGAPAVSAPVVQPLPGTADPGDSAVAPALAFAKLPTIEELEKMSPDELEEVLGLKPTFDIPPAARRSMERIGVIGEGEGGMAATSLSAQDAGLVRAALAGNRGRLVSRWGHILLRRALASRLDAPRGMNPADFAALRASLLLRMGEAEAARALVQDIDTGNYSPLLTEAAFDAYVATADFTGVCPAIATQGDTRRDPQWEAAKAICNAFRGDSSSALSELDRALSRGTMPKIDLLLAQRYAGAAGKSRRAVTIEWDEVPDMTPWRYGLAIAVGLEPPARLRQAASTRYASIAATAPMLGLTTRADAADRVAATGVLSSTAMVDLYSQIYAAEDVTGDWATRAELLRDAYVARGPEARLEAMQQLWDGATGPQQRYSRQVVTAYAAARLPASAELEDAAPDIIASMLTAGLDRNALRWASVADVGSEAWGLLALAAQSRNSPVEADALDSFVDNDDSANYRKSGFLVAGLAGLGRIAPETQARFAERLGYDFSGKSRWMTLIDRAADADNATLVALLAGVGMQGESWEKMTPRFLYHIVAALRKVGLEGEARMIAAEAVARG